MSSSDRAIFNLNVINNSSVLDLLKVVRCIKEFSIPIIFDNFRLLQGDESTEQPVIKMMYDKNQHNQISVEPTYFLFGRTFYFTVCKQMWKDKKNVERPKMVDICGKDCQKNTCHRFENVLPQCTKSIDAHILTS